MSLTASIILESLVNQSSSVWFSRRIKEENLEESIQTFDIDTEEQFNMAEAIWNGLNLDDRK